MNQDTKHEQRYSEMDHKDVFTSSVSHTSRIYEITERVAEYAPNADFDLINRAYVFAAQAHGPQKRKSGELFITHPLAVAGLLAQQRLDVETIITGLLHDTVEDTDVTLEQISELFGKDVAYLVDGVTKLNQIVDPASKQIQQAENLRKMTLAMANDVRVLFVKLADRLHNMTTLGSLSPERAKIKANECLEIYAPLANRLGSYWIKQALQDLAFFTVNREEYLRLLYLRDETIATLSHTPTELSDIIKHGLEKLGLGAKVTWRAKHIYGLYEKMHDKQLEFDSVHDVLALRVIVDDKSSCYQALGLIHELYTPHIGRFKDYIANPKQNLYKSLHTTVYGPDKYLLEIQIRSHAMHDFAENGIASHWLYKDNKSFSAFNDLSWLKNLADLSVNTLNPLEFLKNVQLDLFIPEVFVFSRDGDLYSLPRNATPLDFAYAVHSDVGNQCMGVRINGNNATFSKRLRNGDRIEIITNPEQSPSLTWMQLVKTPKARHAIRQFFKKQNKQDSIFLGEKILRDVSQEPITEDVLTLIQCESMDDLNEKLGRGEISIDKVYRALFDKDHLLSMKGVKKHMLYAAHCCYPVPGDVVVGILVKNHGFELHYHCCNKVLDRKELNWRTIEWKPEDGHVYPTAIELRTENRRGMLATISTIMSDEQANIEDMRMHQMAGEITTLSFLVEVRGRDHLAAVIRRLRDIDGAIKVHRSNKGNFVNRKVMKTINKAVAAAAAESKVEGVLDE